MSDNESDQPKGEGEDLEIESWDDQRFGNRVWWDPSAEIRDAKLEQKQGRWKEKRIAEEHNVKGISRRREKVLVLESFTELNPSAEDVDEGEGEGEGENLQAEVGQEAKATPTRALDPPRPPETETAVRQTASQEAKGQSAPSSQPKPEIGDGVPFEPLISSSDAMDLKPDSHLKIGTIAPQPREVQTRSSVQSQSHNQKSGRHDEAPGGIQSDFADTEVDEPGSNLFRDLPNGLNSDDSQTRSPEPIISPTRGPTPGHPSRPLDGSISPSLPPDYSTLPIPSKTERVSARSRMPDRLGRPDPPARNLTDILPDELTLDLDDDGEGTDGEDVPGLRSGDGSAASWGGFSSTHEPEDFDRGTSSDPVAAANRLGAWLAGILIVLSVIAITAFVLWKFV